MPEYLAVRNDRGDVYPVVASAFDPDIHTEVEGAAVARDGFGRLVVVESAPTSPAKSDSKQAWVDYAVSKGVDPDAAEAMTKAELIEQYDKEQ
jgi:hypothetical protein